jgi:hypothetical protein
MELLDDRARNNPCVVDPEPWQEIRSKFGVKKRIHMKRQSMVLTMVAAASMLMGSALYASPIAIHSPVHAMFGKPKMISFSLHNRTNAPMTVTAGGKELTIAPGKTVDVKLPLGDKVIAQSASANYKAGDVLAVASPELGDATVNLN